MSFKYTATKKGTLSNPFRFVKEGELVVSQVEIDTEKCSWLVPVEQYEAPQELPITATSDAQSSKPVANPNQIPPAPAAEAYNAGMEDIKALEARQDAAATPEAPKPQEPAPAPTTASAVAPVEAPAETPEAQAATTPEAPQTGTGNQDVL